VTGLVVRRIDGLAERQLSQVAEIYAEAFSPELRVPFGELTRPRAVDLTFVALDGNVPAGVAALRLLGSVGAPVPEGGQPRELVRAIYADRYGLPAADPLVSRVLASIVT
jgi:hypothetical protein